VSERKPVRGALPLSHAATVAEAYGTSVQEIDYICVRKANGTVVETPAENEQDMAAEITRQASFYSDIGERHAVVKGLSRKQTQDILYP
jgi:hypothetical protein